MIGAWSQRAEWGQERPYGRAGAPQSADRPGAVQLNEHLGSFGPLLAFWAVGVIAGLKAASAAYLTYATNDYRPILIRGVWACARSRQRLPLRPLCRQKGWAGTLAGTT